MHSQPRTAATLPIDPLHVDLVAASLRAGVGLALLVAPRAAAGLLVGGDAVRPGTEVMARAAGIRDLALALHAVWALDRPADLGRTHRLHAVVDAADALTAVAAARHLTPAGRWAAAIGGAASAAVGLVLAREWRAQAGTTPA